MAVLVLKQESACLTSGSAGHKNIPAERNSRILIPGSGFRASVFEMIVPAVRNIKSRADQSLRQAPGPLGGSVCMFFNSVLVRLFHHDHAMISLNSAEEWVVDGSNDIIICCINVIICSK